MFLVAVVAVVVVVVGGIKNESFTNGSDLSPVILASISTLRKLCTDTAVILHSKALVSLCRDRINLRSSLVTSWSDFIWSIRTFNVMSMWPTTCIERVCCVENVCCVRECIERVCCVSKVVLRGYVVLERVY